MNHTYVLSVHESPACALDLIDALNAADPESAVAVWWGANLPRVGDLQEVHPLAYYVPGCEAKPVHWRSCEQAWLRSALFAFGLGQDAITIVDSDMLPLRRGWVEEVVYPANFANMEFVGTRLSVVAQETDWHLGQVFNTEREMWAPVIEEVSRSPFSFYHHFPPGTIMMRGMQLVIEYYLDSPRLATADLHSKLPCTPYEFIMATLAVAKRKVLPRYGDRAIRHSPMWNPEEEFPSGAGFWIHPVQRYWHDPMRTALRKIRMEWP